MANFDFYQQVSSLSPAGQREVADFVAFLLAEHLKKSRGTGLKKREFGSEKGHYWMAADFDAALEDFKDYMS